MPDARILSLAAGCLPDETPAVQLRAAAEGGWSHTGLWIEPGRNWHEHTPADLDRTLAATGLRVLDVEVVWLHPGPADPDHDRVLAWGAALGARAALVVSSIPDRDETCRRWEGLCLRAEREGIRVVLEHLPITEVRTLTDARAIVEKVDHPAGGLLVDPIHLVRTGGTAADVAALDPRWLPYAQFCDGAAKLADPTPEALLEDAVNGREVPGAGALELDALLAALPPSLPLSLEIRSRSWREAWPDPVARARALHDAVTRWFAARAPGA